MLVHKLDRMESAIAFCRENDDADLWNALIDEATTNSRHITQLLNAAGNYIDPLSVIQKVIVKKFKFSKLLYNFLFFRTYHNAEFNWY